MNNRLARNYRDAVRFASVFVDTAAASFYSTPFLPPLACESSIRVVRPFPPPHHGSRQTSPVLTRTEPQRPSGAHISIQQGVKSRFIVDASMHEHASHHHITHTSPHPHLTSPHSTRALSPICSTLHRMPDQFTRNRFILYACTVRAISRSRHFLNASTQYQRLGPVNRSASQPQGLDPDPLGPSTSASEGTKFERARCAYEWDAAPWMERWRRQAHAHTLLPR